MSPVAPAIHSLWSDVCPLTGLELGEARTVDWGSEALSHNKEVLLLFFLSTYCGDEKAWLAQLWRERSALNGSPTVGSFPTQGKQPPR